MWPLAWFFGLAPLEGWGSIASACFFKFPPAPGILVSWESSVPPVVVSCLVVGSPLGSETRACGGGLGGLCGAVHETSGPLAWGVCGGVGLSRHKDINYA